MISLEIWKIKLFVQWASPPVACRNVKCVGRIIKPRSMTIQLWARFVVSSFSSDGGEWEMSSDNCWDELFRSEQVTKKKKNWSRGEWQRLNRTRNKSSGSWICIIRHHLSIRTNPIQNSIVIKIIRIDKRWPRIAFQLFDKFQMMIWMFIPLFRNLFKRNSVEYKRKQIREITIEARKDFNCPTVANGSIFNDLPVWSVNNCCSFLYWMTNRKRLENICRP